MRNMKVAGLVVALILLLGSAGWFLYSKSQSQDPQPVRADSTRAEQTPPATATPAVAPAVATDSQPAVVTVTPPPEGVETAAVTPKLQPSPAKNVAKPKTPKPPLKDPDARVALALVGADPDAEAYWFGAINDPSLPDNERQDLIEDLNEEGLSDPKNPTLNDLPLILRRLELIEMLAPYAMDKVNLSAFEEAFKDLRNLAARTVGGGQPVN